MTLDKRLQSVIEYIGEHLDESLDLDKLSELTFCSKYHFHRCFTATVGMPLHQYVRWLRLKRSAQQLLVSADQPIIDIALNAGFESYEAYIKTFKKVYGMTPKKFRKKGAFSSWDVVPYKINKNEDIIMDVKIREFSAKRLAMVEHRGNPAHVGNSVNKLLTWAKSQTISLKPKSGDAFALAWDDPKTVVAEEFRLDLGIVVPEGFYLDGGVVEKQLPAGRYATLTHKGSRNNIDHAIYGMLRDWLPSSGEALADFPCVFCYHNFDHEVAETELITEVRFLLQ